MRITVAMAASGPGGWQKRYLEELHAAGVPAYFHYIEGFSWAKRLAWMRDSCERLFDPEDVVVFTDAWDVMFLGTREELEALAKDVAEADAFPFFGAEKNCYPDPWLSSEYPLSLTPWRYLNAGVMMVKAGWLADFLKGFEISMVLDDQRFWTENFLSGVGHLDYGCKMVYNCYLAKPGELVQCGDRVKCTVTNTHPLFVHANGKSAFPPAVYMALIERDQMAKFGYKVGDKIHIPKKGEKCDDESFEYESSHEKHEKGESEAHEKKEHKGRK